jgi:D-alanine-D-alanine ligase
MENSKRTIAIVCGGDSSEHDVSLRSGQGLYSFFDKERYNIYLVDVKGTDWHVALDNGETIEIDKNDFSFVMNGKHVYFDYAYITIHGQPGENGVMQGYFDLIHLPYSTSGVLVEAMTFDKYVLNNYLRGFGINVADSILLRRGDPYNRRYRFACLPDHPLVPSSNRHYRASAGTPLPSGNHMDHIRN